MTGYEPLIKGRRILTYPDLDKIDVSMYLDSEGKFDPSKMEQMIEDTAEYLRIPDIEARKNIERLEKYAKCVSIPSLWKC